MNMRNLVVLLAALFAASCASQPPVVAAAKPAPAAPATVPAAAPVTSVRAVVATLKLENPGFEDKRGEGEACAGGWSCSMHADPHSFTFKPMETGAAGGTRSYCVEAVGKEPWANMTQGLRDIALARGGRVRFSAAVKLEAVTGKGAGPIIIAQGGTGESIGHAQVLATGERGWQRLEVELDVPKATSILEVGMTFEGRGRACMDDARLEVLAPAGPV
jgi:hypothetical protein